MKTKRHFIAAKTKSTVSRTYGGENYTLTIWENKGKGDLVYLGTVSACSRGHRGEISEAWGYVFRNCFTERRTKAFRATSGFEPRWNSYYDSRIHEKAGILLEMLS